MRPNMIYRILLLLCAMAAADTVQPCDESLIVGLKEEDLNFDADKEAIYAYSCVTAGETMKGIKIGSSVYGKINCDPTKGWMEYISSMTTFEPFAKADASFNAACVDYCKWTGEGIKGEHLAKQKYNLLSCVDPSHALFFGDRIITKAQVSCNVKGWKIYNTDDIITKEVDKQQQFECKKAPPCSIPFVPEMHYDQQTNKLTCPSTESKFMRISSSLNTDIEEVKSFTCENGRWKYNDKEMADPLSTPHFHCVEDCHLDGFAAPSENFQKKVVTRGTEEYLEVTCADRLEEINYPQPRHETTRGVMLTPIDRNVAICHWGKWTDGNGVPINSKLSCSGAPDCSVVEPTDGIELDRKYMYKGFTHRKVTCASSGRALRAILFNSTQYTSLICDTISGWFDPGMKNSEDRIAKRDKPLEATCVEYCASIGEGLKIELIANTNAHVTCEDSKAKLVYGGKQVIDGGAAICTRDKGWMVESEPLSSDIATPAKFECKSAPTTPTTATTTVAPEQVPAHESTRDSPPAPTFQPPSETVETATTQRETTKEESGNGSKTAPDVTIARILLLALFRCLFMNI